MRLLLDSQIVYLLVTDPSRIPARVLDEMGRSHVTISAVSFWELAIKQEKGKLRLPDDALETLLASDRFHTLDITTQHGLAAARLPAHHGDPFDRVLIAQAQSEGMTLVGSDGVFAEYDVDVLWG